MPPSLGTRKAPPLLQPLPLAPFPQPSSEGSEAPSDSFSFQPGFCPLIFYSLFLFPTVYFMIFFLVSYQDSLGVRQHINVIIGK